MANIAALAAKWSSYFLVDEKQQHAFTDDNSTMHFAGVESLLRSSGFQDAQSKVYSAAMLSSRPKINNWALRRCFHTVSTMSSSPHTILSQQKG
jgi:hypothetical protein